MRASQLGARLFRNNVALGWVGKVRQLGGGTVVLENARPLHAGLQAGSADLIGWKTVTITPDMVGQRVALFYSVEVKKPGGRTRPEQVEWRNMVTRFGGIALVAFSEDDLA